MVTHPHTHTVINDAGDAVEENMWLRVGWRLLMIIFCWPLVTAVSCIHQEAEVSVKEKDGNSLCLSPLRPFFFSSFSRSFHLICMSVSVKDSLLVLSAFWLSINMRFVICLDYSQHSEHFDNPSASGFIHLAGLQYFDCGVCMHMCACLPLCLCQSLY